MKNRTALNVWWTLTILAACIALLVHPNGAAAEEPLYPHAERQSGPWGYIDKSGRVVIPLQFESAQPFSEGLAAIEVHNRESTLLKKYGFIDRTGSLVIPAQFSHVQPFRSGRAGVALRPGPNGWGMIDREGKLIVPPAYAHIGSFSDGRAVVSVADSVNKRRTGAIDLDGQVAVPLEYEGMMRFSEGLAVAWRDKKAGFVDKNGAVAVPFHYTTARSFSAGLAPVFKGPNGESGFIDKTGALVVPFDYDMVHGFSEGYAVTFKRGKGGLIDAAGNVAIPPRFVNIGRPAGFPTPYQPITLASLSEGLLPASMSWSQGFGYVDREGAFVIQPRFAQAFSFNDGLAVVKVNAEQGFGVQGAKGLFAGLIDRSGQFVAPAIFDWIKPHPGGLWQVQFGDRLGYLDARGRPLTFSSAELDAYVTQRREKLKEHMAAPAREAAKPLPRPAPGRGLFAKAGDTEYYLHLPEGLCPLDDSQPADRKFIEDRWTESDKAFEAMKALKPMSIDVEQAMRKNAEDHKLKARYVLGCDQLAKLRAGTDSRIVESYVLAIGTQKDRYDPSMGAGAVWANALICGVLRGDVFKWSDGMEKDSTGTVTEAFKRLAAGQAIALRATAPILPACYRAIVTPDSGAHGGGSNDPSAAKLMSHAMLSWGDWIVLLQTTSNGVSSPDAFFREYERIRATIEAIAKANARQ